MNRVAILALSCLVLAACSDDPSPGEQADENATARGEVLGGTISDDMLPLDTLTSQSPPRGGGSSDEGDNDNDNDSEPAPASDPAPQPEPAPAAEPAPEPESEPQAEPEE